MMSYVKIYDALCGTQVVLVSSKREIGEGIVKSVHKFNGAV
jgi:hypothetical protein